MILPMALALMQGGAMPAAGATPPRLLHMPPVYRYYPQAALARDQQA